LKYTPEGGRVTITARDRDSDILVSVHDTGIGIPKKDLDMIFSGFYHAGYKLSYEYKGPGLGLAISRKIIESHGGHIWAESEEGKGSTFYFTIPKFMESVGTIKNTAEAR
jgi:signal transduction histidine kinase